MNTEEFKRLVPVLQPPMQRMAEQMLGSRPDAKDVVQDLFVELWQRRHQLGKVANLEGYCVRMTQYRCIDQLKKRHLASPLSEAADVPDTGQDDREWLFEELQRRLADLPEEELELLQMRYWEQVSGKEMSHRLKISEGNVRVRLNRIIQKLKEDFTLNKKTNYERHRTRK